MTDFYYKSDHFIKDDIAMSYCDAPQSENHDYPATAIFIPKPILRMQERRIILFNRRNCSFSSPD